MSSSIALRATAPGARQDERRRVAGWQLAAGIVLAAIAALAPLWAAGRFAFGDDFDVYRAAGTAVLQGASPYDFTLERGFLFIYTPFAAVPMVLLALLGANAALAVWTFVSVLALQATLWAGLGRYGVASPARRANLTLAFTVASLPLTPVLVNLWLGQINLVILVLIVADLARRSGRFRGVGVGIAAGIKLTPLIFVVYLLITRQYRAARNAVAGFVATVLVGFVVMPATSWTYWFSGRFADTSRMFPEGADLTWNHSLRGVIALHSGSEAAETTAWLVAAVVVGVLGLAAARLASLRGNELAGIVACGLTGVLISPLSWSPHWVWVAPLLVIVVLSVTPRPVVRGATLVVLWVVLAGLTYYWIPGLLLGIAVPPELPASLFTHLIVAAGLLALLVLPSYRAPSYQVNPLAKETSASTR